MSLMKSRCIPAILMNSQMRLEADTQRVRSSAIQTQQAVPALLRAKGSQITQSSPINLTLWSKPQEVIAQSEIE